MVKNNFIINVLNLKNTKLQREYKRTDTVKYIAEKTEYSKIIIIHKAPAYAQLLQYNIVHQSTVIVVRTVVS